MSLECTPVRIGTGPLVSPTRMGSEDICSPRWSISPQEFRNVKPLDTSINGNSYKHRDPAPTLSKIIGSKFSNQSSANIYLLCWMNLTRDTILTESPNFMYLGLSSVHTTDELGSVFIPTTRSSLPTYGSNWLPFVHRISEATEDIVSGTRP